MKTPTSRPDLASLFARQLLQAAAVLVLFTSAAASGAAPGLRVAKVLPTGGAGHPFDTIEVTFSQAVQDGTFTVADAKLTSGADILPSAVNKLASDRYEIVFTGLTSVANYGLVIGPNISDASGNPMDQNRNGVPGEASGDSYRGNLYGVATLINTAGADGQGIVAYGTTLTIEGVHAFESLFILGGATVTHPAATANATSSLDLAVSGDVWVDGTSKIDASGLGYLSGKTLSHAGIVGQGESGGSYGGLGANDLGAANPVYGDYANPNEMGSGGASGGAGGGLIRLSAASMELAGAIRADGQAASGGGYYGGGSGGGIRLDVATLAGNGTVSVNGGSGYYGASGGGGRLAIYFTDASGFDLANKAMAHGGDGGQGVGAVGSVYLKKAGQEGELWLVSHGANTGSWTPLGISTDTSFVSEKLIISGAGVVAKPEHQMPISANDLTVQNGALLTIKASDAINTYSLQATVARTLTVDAASSVNVSSLGYPADRTLGNVSGAVTGESGGSYGGLGANDLGVANPVYGDYANPNEMGSGGASGGAGGGLIRLSAASIELAGAIRADGQAASGGGYYGGGSGGGIRLDVTTLSGNGTVSVNGGSGYYGGSGGGGRLAIYFTDASGFDLANKAMAHGGDGGQGVGAVGSVYLKKVGQEGELWLVSHGANTGAWTPLGISTDTSFVSEKLIISGAGVVAKPEHQMPISANDLTLQNGALLTTKASDAANTYSLQATVARTLRVDATSSVDVSSLGYPSDRTLGNVSGGVTGESGGSYGGLGANDVGMANPVYGDYVNPNEMGSGGASGGKGGGLIRLSAASIELAGAIRADGQAASGGGYYGGGSGGGIRLDVTTLSGNGTVSVNGGSGYYGGSGGGGRLAIYFTDASGFDLANKAMAHGGDGGQGVGAVGSVYLKKVGQEGELWLVSHGANTGAWTPLGISTDTSFVSEKLIISGAGVVAKPEHQMPISANDLTLQNGALLTTKASDAANTYSLQATVARTLRVDATSSVDVSSLGYLSDRTLGNVSGRVTGESGGSYGGLGANDVGAANPVYGDYRNPNEMGSGGASGGKGGGLIRISAANIQLAGSIRANGQSADGGGYYGGGSGGGIRLDVNTLAGNGTVSVNGGYGYYGGSGGGGRVAIYFNDASGFDLANKAMAHGGDGGQGIGAVGSVYLKKSGQEGELWLVSHGANTGSWTPLGLPGDSAFSAETVVVKGSGVVVKPEHEMTLQAHHFSLLSGAKLTSHSISPVSVNLRVSGNFTLDAESSVDVSAQGYKSGQTISEFSAASGESGGSYGGSGASDQGVTNPLYGSEQDPRFFGSGGASGGAGGGVFRLSAHRAVLNGSLLANGSPASSGGYYGGGSGGSLLINAGSISGNGTVAANGGAGYYGGSGGGGRVAVYSWTSNDFPTEKISANGGTGGAGSGGNGTVVVRNTPLFGWDSSNALLHGQATTGWYALGVDASALTADLLTYRNGPPVSIVSGASAAGSIQWNTSILPDGVVELKALFKQGGQVIGEVSETVLVNNSAVWHSGNISSNETWSADKVHIVESSVAVTSNATLTILPGAVVKFAPDAGLTISAGATVSSLGTDGNPIVMTSLSDDSVGGDTNYDGSKTRPLAGDWAGIALLGDGKFDSNADIRYISQTHTGTLAGNEAWMGTMTHKVSGIVTVPTGATLTINPGAVVKFESGAGITVSSGAILNAQGASALPIVFTSYKDDLVGGDINHDADLTSPSAGNWRSIRIESGGSATINHAEVWYGGDSIVNAYSAGGMIENVGGNVTITNSTIAQSLKDGFLGGGVNSITNSIILNNDRALTAWGSPLTINHCTFYGNRLAAECHGGTLTVLNSVLTHSLHAGIDRDWGGAEVIVKNCLLWNPNAQFGNYYAGRVPDMTGTNGNISVDPKFRDAEGGDFRLGFRSPAIDAADGTTSPATDSSNAPRYDDPRVVNTGTAMPDGAFADMGAFEFVEGAASDVDLVVTQVSGPDKANAGDEVTIRWTVANLGTRPARGPWKDVLSMVADSPTRENARVVLGDAVSSISLAAGESAECTAKVKVPGGTSGQWRWEVQANALGEVFEGANLANNVGPLSAPFALSIPSLSLTSPRTGSLASGETSVWYEVAQSAGTELLVDWDPAATEGRCRIYAGFGSMPTKQDFDLRSGSWNSPDARLSVPAPSQDRTVYLLIVAERLVGDDRSFTVSAAGGGFRLDSTDLAEGSSAGSVTARLVGGGFKEGMTVELRSSDGLITRNATTVRVEDSTTALVTFDLRGLTLAAYDIVANLGGTPASLSSGFTVNNKPAGEISTKVILPTYARAGRPFEGLIEFTNVGSTDLAVPLLVLSGGTRNPVWQKGDENTDLTSLQYLAADPDKPCSGVLRPGESHVIPFETKSIVASPYYQISILDAGRSERVDWAAFKTTFRPEDPHPLWEEAWSALVTRIGTSYASYLSALVSASDEMIGFGIASRNVDEILGYMIRREMYFLPGSLNTGNLTEVGTGRPLGDTTVRLRSLATDNEYLTVSWYDGRIVFRDLPAGTYEVNVHGRFANPSQITIGANGTISLQAAPGAAIAGRVSADPEGTPVAGALVTVEIPQEDRVFEAVTDELGAFTLTGLAPGLTRINIRAEGLPMPETVYITTASGVTTELAWRLEEGGEISGSVVGPNGLPLANATVAASCLDLSSQLSTETDASGNYQLTGLMAGNYTVSADATGFGGSQITGVVVKSASVTSNQTISLTHAGQISGSVLSSVDGAPVADAVVTIISTELLAEPALTSGNGTFSISDLAPGALRLHVSAQGFLSELKDVTITANQTSSFSVSLAQAGSIAGQVTSPAGEVFGGLSAILILPDGTTRWTETSSAGAFEFTSLPMGSYSIEIRTADSVLLSRQSVTLGDSSKSATVPINVAFAELAGSIFLADGLSPAADCQVSLLKNGTVVAESTTGANGTYSFLVMQDGAMDVTASGNGVGLTRLVGVNVSTGTDAPDKNLTAGSQSIKLHISSSALGLTSVAGAHAFAVPDWADSLSLGGVSGFADSDGIISLPNLASGNYTVYISATGTAPQRIAVAASASPGTLEVNLTAGRAVTGVVKDSTGNLLSDVSVRAWDPVTKTSHYATTNAIGQYVFDSLPEGTLSLVAYGSDLIPVVVSGINTANSYSVNLPITIPSTGTPVSGIVSASSTPIDGAHVSLVGPDGSSFFSVWSSENGSYTIPALAAGNYTLQVESNGYAPVQQSLAVPTAGVVNLPLAAPVAAAIDAGLDIRVPLKTKTAAKTTVRDIINSFGYNLDEAFYPQRIRPLGWEYEWINVKPSKPCDAFRRAQEACNFTDDLVYNAYTAWLDAKSGQRGEKWNDILKLSANVAKIAGDIASTVLSLMKIPTSPEMFSKEEWAELGPLVTFGIDTLNNARDAFFSGDFSKGGTNLAFALGKLTESKVVNIFKKRGVNLAEKIPFVGQLVKICKIVKDSYEKYQEVKKEYAVYQGMVKTLYEAYRSYRVAIRLHEDNYKYLLAAANWCQNKPHPGGLPPTPPWTRNGGGGSNQIKGAVDPNEKITIGYGSAGWIVGNTLIPYTILFENKPDASAAAQLVTVTDQLDTTHLDLSTFELQSIGFNGLTIDVPPGLQEFTTEVNVDTDPNPVRVTAKLDPETGIVSWAMESFDAQTGELPADPLAGFLPPNDAEHRGEGFVKYSIRLKPNLPTGTQILNKASIVFDVNDAIITNEVINSVDIVAPTSSVNTLETFSLPEFTLSWSGTDEGSGISLYDVYVSENNGAPTLWAAGTALTSSAFTGSRGSTYAFYAVATDNVGWTQSIPASHQALTKIKAVSSAVADLYETGKNSALSVPVATGVLTNDLSPDGLPLTAVIDSQVSHGNLTLSANGSFTYTPDKDFMGLARFTYHVNDGMENSSPATVVLYVGPVPGIDVSGPALTATVATPFSYQIKAEGSPTAFAAAGLPKGLTVNKTTGLISGTPAEGGTFQLKLSAKNAKGTGTVTTSLTVTNPFDGLTGNYYALVDIDANHPLGGTLALTLTPSGAYTGKLKSGKLTYPLKGQLDSSGNGTVSAVLRKAATLNGTLSIALTGNSTGTLAGAIPAGTKNIRGELTRKVPKSPGSQLAGYYTMLIEPSAGDVGVATKPQGAGFAAMTIDKTAGVKFSGHLADGSVFTSSGPLWANGEVPVYALLGGCCAAAIGNPLVQSGNITGTLDWVKLPAPGTLYPAGFSMSLDVAGSLWSPQASTNLLTGLAGQTGFTFALDPDQVVLPAGIDQAGQWPDTNKPALTAPVTPGIGLTVAPKTGIFTGKVPVLIGGKTKSAKVQGVLLSKPLPEAGGSLIHGAGFFLGEGASAPVWITTP